MEETNWQEVVDRQPRGYVELNDMKRVIHGPVESVEIEGDDVVIKTKWQARVELDEIGLPKPPWKGVPENNPIRFPGRLVSYVFEDTPEKGRRVRFGFNILYLNEVEGLDLAKVVGLEVPA